MYISCFLNYHYPFYNANGFCRPRPLQLAALYILLFLWLKSYNRSWFRSSAFIIDLNASSKKKVSTPATSFVRNALLLATDRIFMEQVCILPVYQVK